MRDHEYKRHGTVSLLAGIDLLTGQVHALVKDRHRSREFIELLRLLDAGYPAHTAIKLILENHSAYISKETKAWLANQPAGRFEFTFTPKHGRGSTSPKVSSPSSPLGAAPHPRRIQQELKHRIMAAMDEFNRDPVVHTWSYRPDLAARSDSKLEIDELDIETRKRRPSSNCFEFRAALEAVMTSQADFASLLKVERSTVSRWFSGEREVPHTRWSSDPLWQGEFRRRTKRVLSM